MQPASAQIADRGRRKAVKRKEGNRVEDPRGVEGCTPRPHPWDEGTQLIFSGGFRRRFDDPPTAPLAPRWTAGVP